MRVPDFFEVVGCVVALAWKTPVVTLESNYACIEKRLSFFRKLYFLHKSREVRELIHSEFFSPRGRTCADIGHQFFAVAAV